MPAKKTNNSEPLDATQAQPFVQPPDDATVDVETKLKYRMDGSAGAQLFGQRERDAGITDEDLEALAGDDDLLLDPLSRFCAEWSNYIGYSLVIIRLPDPAARRMPGNQFRNPCFEVENLGEIPFDPSSLVGTLQMVNNHSGGAFRLFLRNHDGQPIPDARLDRVVISDPARGYAATNPGTSHALTGAPAYSPASPATRQLPEKSEFEKRIEGMQAQLFETAIQRALNPPAPAPGSNLSDEDRLAVMLLSKGDLLSNVVTRLTALAQAPDAAAANPSWKDRLIEAGIDIASKNPVLIERVSSTVERIIQTILPPRVGVPITEPVNYAPAAQPGTSYSGGRVEQLPAQSTQASEIRTYDIPDTVQADDDETATTTEDPEEDEDMEDIVERIITRLGQATPLEMSDPIFKELLQAYPVKFRLICGLIESQDVDNIIEYIADKSELYETILTGAATGSHYRARIIELQALLKNAKQTAEQKIAAARAAAAQVNQQTTEQTNVTEQNTAPATAQAD